MSRRSNSQNRCALCAMHLSLCICDEIPRIDVATSLCLVMHRDEVRKTTNTGRLAARCLVGSKILVHGRVGERVQAPWLEGGGQEEAARNHSGQGPPKRWFLLYPEEEAETLEASHFKEGPVHLVVPDGTWRQAAKMARRLDWMAQLPRVSLPPGGAETRYRLRSEPKDGGLATMEAIARALGVLEGPEVETRLYEVFCKMTDRTLYSRGLLSRQQVYGGIPDGTLRHEPRRSGEKGGWRG